MSIVPKKYKVFEMCAFKVTDRYKYARKPVAEKTASHSITNESLLQKLSYISQIGLLALGIFGYFYTVVPVFQNQQLQEQTAKLELEKSDLEREKKTSHQELMTLKVKRNEVEQNIQMLQAKWESEKKRNMELLNNIQSSKKKELEAKLAKINTENLLSNEQKNLDNIRWNLILSTLSNVSAFSILREYDFSFNSKDNYENGIFILEQKKNWTKPYSKLLSLIDEVHKTSKQIPASYFLELENYVKSKEVFLQCQEPNYGLLQKKYLDDVSTLEPSIDAELVAEIEKIKQEYKGTNQIPVFTDEYKIKQRKAFKLGKLFKLKDKYWKELHESETKCRDKISIVIEEMKALKGVN